MALIFLELHPLYIVYFGVPPKDLSIAQSAYLIGLLQSPYGYTPYEKDGTLKSNKDLKYSIQRQHYVLKRMLIEDQITKKNTTTH